MNGEEYFLGEDGVISNPETGEKKRVMIAFADNDEEKARMQEAIDKKREENADNKKYLILFAGYVDDEEFIGYNPWVMVVGRQNAYDTVKDYFLSKELSESGITFDAYESRIVVESKKGGIRLDGISVYKFMKSMKSEGKVVDDSDFDIEEWAVDVKDENI